MSTALGTEPTASADVADAAISRLPAVLAPPALARFAAVALQFGILVSITRAFEIDNPSLVASIKLVWLGWLLHHFLPQRLRLPFFAALSMALVIQTFGARDGGILLAVGAALIAACHIPVRFGARIGIVLVAAAMVAALRGEWLHGRLVGAIPPRLWPILGSMFMFRLIAYLYDLKHGAAPTGPWRAAAYFFMLPNACFPLFPVVDYKTFVRSHFAEDAFGTYRVGLQWMWRGLLQLLAYQVVYLFWVTDPLGATSLGDVAWYAFTTFLLYLRVSGLFHLIVGILRLFGFALPETHHLYFLSSSFTDFWRRINIYWKEFLTKVFFYPAFVRLKRLGRGEAFAMIAATLFAFSATWFLHGYQLFWVRGRFPITWQDVLFWFGLGVLVVVNMRMEARRPRGRRLRAQRRELRSGVALGLRTAGTFAALCVLWTIWNTSTTGLRTLAAASLHATALQVLAIAGVLAGIGLAGVWFGGSAREGTRSAAPPSTMEFWTGSAKLLALSSMVLVIGKEPGILVRPEAVSAVTQVAHSKFNRVDLLGRDRGYYQDVDDALIINVQMGRLAALAPTGWNDNPAQRLRDDPQLWDYRPSASVTFKLRSFSTNRWGMRDRDYTQSKPAGTFRIVLAGSSHEAGSGVRDSETYENVLERRLASEATHGERYEVLNFAVDGYSPLQKLEIVEARGLRFAPDVVLYAVHSNEREWVTKRLEDVVAHGYPLSLDFVSAVLAKAGVRRGDGPDVIQHKLRPYRDELLMETFARLRRDCDSTHTRAVALLVEHADEAGRPAALDSVAAIARAAGLTVLDLRGAFDGVAVRESLYVAPWDTHPNPLGHELLARKLETELRRAGLIGASDATRPPVQLAGVPSTPLPK